MKKSKINQRMPLPQPMPKSMRILLKRVSKELQVTMISGGPILNSKELKIVKFFLTSHLP